MERAQHPDLDPVYAACVALDVPLGTVKSRLHLALRELREDNRIKALFDP